MPAACLPTWFDKQRHLQPKPAHATHMSPSKTCPRDEVQMLAHTRQACQSFRKSSSEASCDECGSMVATTANPTAPGLLRPSREPLGAGLRIVEVWPSINDHPQSERQPRAAVYLLRT
eukprot:1105409-Alexandrium_andersonii.AAC.1